MLTRAQKEEQVGGAPATSSAARPACIVADYRGLDVESVNKLRAPRAQARAAASYEYRVREELAAAPRGRGHPAYARVAQQLRRARPPSRSSFGDPVGARQDARRLRRRRTRCSSSRAASWTAQPLERAEIATLATLPSLDELRGKLVGLLPGAGAASSRGSCSRRRARSSRALRRGARRKHAESRAALTRRPVPVTGGRASDPLERPGTVTGR